MPGVEVDDGRSIADPLPAVGLVPMGGLAAVGDDSGSAGPVGA